MTNYKIKSLTCTNTQLTVEYMLQPPDDFIESELHWEDKIADQCLPLSNSSNMVINFAQKTGW